VVLLDAMKDAVEACGLTRRAMCAACGLSRETERRWRLRKGRGEAAVRSPGPRRPSVADFAGITAEARCLRHGPRRSFGGPALARRHRSVASRREVGKIIRAERWRCLRLRRDARHAVEWHGAMAVWSMDDTEMELGGGRGKCWMHNVRDLGAGYCFEPLAGPRLASGTEVAANLERLFRRFGAPLVLKRDNGSNLCCDEVNEVLWRWRVMALNNPPSYPPYNGAMERSQTELKSELLRQLEGQEWSMGNLRTFVRLASHSLNHRPKGGPKGAMPCHMLSTTRKYFTTKQRKEALYDIEHRERIILEGRGVYTSPASARRCAISEHLQHAGLMTLKEPKCVNQF